MYTIINFILSFALFIILSGLFVYKIGHASTWEKGITTLFQWVGKGISKLAWWAYSNDTTARQYNPSAMPTPKETTAIVNSVERHPYDSASVDWCKINSSDVFMLKIGAFGLSNHYAGLKPAEICEVVCRVIHSTFLELRESVPYFYVPYARQDGFLLLIPLSDFGKQALTRKIEEARANETLTQARNSAKVNPLTEEVPEADDEADV